MPQRSRRTEVSESSGRQTTIDEQWRELQRLDRWTVSAAVAAATHAHPSTPQHGTALRWRPHEPHELEAMSAWADLQAAETKLVVAHKRGRRTTPALHRMPRSSLHIGAETPQAVSAYCPSGAGEKRGRCLTPESSSPASPDRKRNRWAAVMVATELAFVQQCSVSA
eukprot:CAMPEP_0119059762 /NCGR_PEP_ID=MMETSP1178-20130426/3821_1 /TAXON_ID=33656 /ORGANISM="unid sp, Strain CCMP2000" /LENGTH=166 /DNA_ID=CAMNT_0007040817 /DNA_START=28 /DNA_END=528 /DNA_ORIENTATION=+